MQLGGISSLGVYTAGCQAYLNVTVSDPNRCHFAINEVIDVVSV